MSLVLLNLVLSQLLSGAKTFYHSYLIKLTLSKERAPALFRSDVDASLLKKIKTGTLLGSMWSSDLNLTKGIHPFLSSGAPSYIVGGTYEDLMVITYNNQDSSDHPDKYKFFSENATNPPVSTLKVNAFDEDLFRKPPKYQVSVTGTGRPLFGGELRAVTCKDVMLAVTVYGDKFSYCKFCVGCHCATQPLSFLLLFFNSASHPPSLSISPIDEC